MNRYPQVQSHDCLLMTAWCTGKSTQQMIRLYSSVINCTRQLGKDLGMRMQFNPSKCTILRITIRPLLPNIWWSTSGGTWSQVLMRYYQQCINTEQPCDLLVHYCVLLHHSDFGCTNVCSIFLIWLFWEINMDAWMEKPALLWTSYAEIWNIVQEKQKKWHTSA